MPRRSTQTGILCGTPSKRLKTMELPACPEVRACHTKGTPPGTVHSTLSGLLPGVFRIQAWIADFAIHDKGDGNPHAHSPLTMRAMDETGKWLPKSRKVYDLDENGERIRLASGRWKSHKEDTVDWNDQKYAEIWRQGWADTANRYLEAIDSPERLDLRSYARQGIDKSPPSTWGQRSASWRRKAYRPTSAT